jgi:hypothetical protein
MIRRSVLVVLAVTLLAGAGLVSRPLLLAEPPLTVTGDVHMVTSPDGLTTAVSIDVGDAKYPPDGLVDHAFRLQHKAEQALAYDGVATITYANASLRLDLDEGAGWVFAVKDTRTSLSDRALAYPWLFVTGLSYHWGAKIHRSHDEVAALLLASGCKADEGDPSCENCEAGGPGAEGCGVECDEGGCSAHCGGGGSFACCSCPGTCRCCPDKEGAPAASPDQH